MTIRKFYDQIMGSPLVYDVIRPFLLGGIDNNRSYQQLTQNQDDVLLDIGCGTGEALRYIKIFKKYAGFDLDSRAIDRFRIKYSGSNISTFCRPVTKEDVCSLAPNKAIMAGLLHHLNDQEVRELLDILSAGQSVKEILTIDVLFIKGLSINNLLASLDRGRYVRDRESYLDIIKGTDFEVQEDLIDSSNRFASYFSMKLIRKGM